MYDSIWKNSREGTIEEEIGSLCVAFTYKPSFTVWKMAIVGELMRVFINEFNLNPEIQERTQKTAFLSRDKRHGKRNGGVPGEEYSGETL